MSKKVAYAFLDEHFEHDHTGHPENSGRLLAINKLLSEHGVFDRLARLPCTMLDDEALLRIHTRRHVQTVRQLSEAGGGLFDPETYATPATARVSLRAAGGVVEVARCVARGDAERGFAIVRPPGHHAGPDRVMGFCIFNSIAVATRQVMIEFGIDRVAIIDMDVHHGNGTQDAFYGERDILFFSTHQYPFYPGTGHLQEIGEGAGRFANVNVPLPAGTGDRGLSEAFSSLGTPIIERFKPQMIFVSAGFDAHFADPLGGFNASISGFADLIRTICEWADAFAGGRVTAALEGGYNTEVLAYSVLATIEKLASYEASVLDPFGPALEKEPEVRPLLSEIRRLHGD